MPRLIVKLGPDTGASYELDPAQKLFVGRASDLAFQIHDPRASRRHCVIAYRDDRWLLKNLEPPNGTHINGRMLESSETAQLNDGDLVEIGNSVVTFLDEINHRDDPLIGRKVGNYHVHRELGRGGVAVVYLATQIQLGREVALKTLMPSLTSDEGHLERFYQEGRSTAAINHPLLVTVYDAGVLALVPGLEAAAKGQAADGATKQVSRAVPYFSMEYAPHGSVHDEVRASGPMPLARAMSVAMQMLEALAHLEDEGVVHRDVKPQNIFCFPKGVVKLGDLGLAISKAEVARPRGGLLGTPHYVSPEQARGMPMDHRADLYSLAATLFRLIAGRPMFSAASAREIAKAQVKQTPPPMSTYRLGVPEQLERIIARMLQKHPDHRYQHAREVQHALSLVTLPPEASQQTAWQQQAPWATHAGTTAITPVGEISSPTGPTGYGASHTPPPPPSDPDATGDVRYS